MKDFGQADDCDSVENWGKDDRADDQLILEGSLDLVVLLYVHQVCGEEGGHKGGSQSEGGDQKGVVQVGSKVVGVAGVDELLAGSSNSQCGAGGLGEGTEQIGTHSGDITDIVSDVIGNGGGVLGGVFWEVVLNFSDEVGSDVGSLGEDTTTNTGEEGHGGTTETISGDTLHYVGEVGWVGSEIAVNSAVDGNHEGKDHKGD